MTGKERVQAALNFEPLDRPPVSATFTPEIELLLREKTGIQPLDIGASLGNDLVKGVAGNSLEMSYYRPQKPSYTCPWGIGWRWVNNQFGSFTEICNSPLANDDEEEMDLLKAYRIPSPHDEAQYEPLKKLILEYGKEKWMVGSCQISLFEAAWYLRGMENFMVDMMINPDYAHTLFDKMMEFVRVAGQKYIALGVDMVWLGDDVATQQNMMMSLDTWRIYLKPRYAELISGFKALNPNIKVAYHSCGNCEAMIPEMIEIGLDVLNPLQPMAISPFEMKQKYGRNIALFGGLCVQQTMPNGTPAQVKEAVRKLKAECGRGGGFILSPAHHIQADTPIGNVMAFYDEALKII
ncbi:MAG: hypothetical protein K9M54_06500 [Kiritimatiellales bacterium]|nr:hypothetical protein [Kiritimatiellales bacterium]